MALPSTLYRFTIQLSDVDRGVYQPLELRVAMHPSESLPYLLTRVIAYALNTQEGLEFTNGISSPDDPALWIKDLTGSLQCWIDIGNPSARRLHKAAKAAKRVRVYTYRDPAILAREVEGEPVYRKEEIEVFALAPAFLTALAETLERDNKWEFLHTQGELSIHTGKRSVTGDLTQHRLAST